MVQVPSDCDAVQAPESSCSGAWDEGLSTAQISLRVQDILQQQSTLEINDLFSHSINPDADDEGVREFECLACT
jgi:hypothetical protein